MKYSIKNSGKWTNQMTLSDKILNVIEKIKGLFNGKDSSIKEPNLFGNVESDLSWEVEASLDISVDEMKTLIEVCSESDKNAWALLKEMGKDILVGAKEFRKTVKEEIPEWQKIFQDADNFGKETKTEE